jgi:hypothetical protein
MHTGYYLANEVSPPSSVLTCLIIGLPFYTDPSLLTSTGNVDMVRIGP